MLRFEFDTEFEFDCECVLQYELMRAMGVDETADHEQGADDCWPSALTTVHDSGSKPTSGLL